MGCGTHEKKCGYEVEETGCPKCGGPAFRKSVYLTSIVTESGPLGGRLATVPLSDRRYNVSRFQEASQEIDYAHTKAENERGRTLEAPDLYKAGLNKARQMGAKIRAT